MTDAIAELKVRAEILQRKIERAEAGAIGRLRALPQFRRLPEEALVRDANIQRRDCLNILAAELGFASWTQAKNVISGEGGDGDFGTALCPPRCAIHTNLWYRDYDEAAQIRAQKNGYLLGFRRQFVVVDRHYLDTLRLDPDDADWAAIGFDWVRPLDTAARTRLYGKLVAAMPKEGV